MGGEFPGDGRDSVSNNSTITTLFSPRKSTNVSLGAGPSTESAWKMFGRFLGRVLLFFSMFFFLSTGYLAFAHYWILTHWTKAEATVLSGELRQLSSGSRKSGSSRSYFFHCTVSYPVADETRQSQLDSPASPYRLDAQVWAARLSPGQHIAILYKSSDQADIRLLDNPAEATAVGSLRVALYFFAPGILLVLTSRQLSS